MSDGVRVSWHVSCKPCLAHHINHPFVFKLHTYNPVQLSGILAVHPPAGSTDDDDKDLNQLRVLEHDVTALLRAKASTWTNQLTDDDHHDYVVSSSHEFRNDGKSMYKRTLWYALLVDALVQMYIRFVQILYMLYSMLWA